MPSIDIKITAPTKELEAAVMNVQRTLNGLASASKDVGEHIDSAFDGAKDGAEGAAKAVGGLGKEMMDIEKLAKQAGTAIAGYFALDQLMAFGSACIEVRKEFESLEVSFATLLGSETAGKAMFDSLTQFATTTPLMEKDIASAAQTLLGFNISAEKVLPLLKAIGDVSMGDAQKFQSLTLAFAQATSAGKLMGQDLMQMINAGFNPLGEMARTSGKSIGQLKKDMEEGKISAQMLEDAFVSATSEGGKFNGMLENMSKTMQGAKSNLDGAIQKFQGELGRTVEPIFVEIVNRGYEAVNEITEAFESMDISIDENAIKEYLDEIERAIKAVVVAFGTFKAAELTIIGLTTATKAWAAATDMAAVHVALANKAGVTLTATQALLSMATTRLSIAYKALTTAMLSNPITMAAAAFAALATSMYLVINNIEKVEYKIKDLSMAEREAKTSTSEEIDKLKDLRKTAEDTNKSLDERKKAVVALQSQYPEYFGNMSQEKIMCGEVGDAYTELAAKILKSAKARAAYEMMVENQKEMLRLEHELEEMDKKKIRRGQLMLKQQKEFIEQTSKQVGTSNGATYAAVYLQRQTNQYTKAALRAGGLYNAIEKLKKANDKLKEIAEEPEVVTPKTPQTPTTTSTKGKADKTREAEKDVKERYDAFKKAVEKISEQTEGEIVKAYQRTIDNAMQLRIDAMESEHEDALEKIQTNLREEKEAMLDAAKNLYEAQLKMEIAHGKRKENDRPQFSRENLKALLPDVSELLEEQEAALDTAAQNMTDFENSAFKKQWTDLYDELLSNTEDYLLKREALEKEYAKKIAEAQTAFDYAPEAEKAKIKAYIDALQKQLEEELGKMDNDKFQEMLDLDSMLGDVSGYSSQKLDEMAAGLEKIIAANKDITPDGIQRIKTLQEALSQLYAVRAEKNPAKEVQEATKALQDAKAALDAAAKSKQDADKMIIADKAGNASTYGEQYEQAVTNDDVQRMVELQNTLVFINGEWQKYGDIIKANTLAQGRYARAVERSKNANEKAYEQFQKVMGVMNKASRAIVSAGDLFTALGTTKLGKVAGTMAEIGDIAISAVGDIKDTMVEASKSIKDVTEAAADGAKGAATGAATAISSVEKASVILTIISAAVQIATKIFNLVSSMHNDKLDKKIKQLDKQLDTLGDKYEDLGDAIKKSYSQNAAKLIDEENKNLQKQNEILKEQMRLEKQKKQSDEEMQEAMKQYQDQIRANNKLIEENKAAAIEAIMGEDVQAAISRFAEAYSSAWTGEGSAKANAKKAVKTMVENMLQEALKQDLSAPVGELQKRLMDLYGKKGFITEQDMAAFEREAEEIAKRMEAKYGFADELFKADSNFNGTSGAFQTMSQESADELNGRFAQAQAAVQGTYEAMLEGNDLKRAISSNLESIREGFVSLEENIATANGYLNSIDGNIATMVKEVIPSLQTIETIVRQDR